MFYGGMLSVFYGLITKNNNMELKDLEEMFKMEQELDIPHRDRWYNKDFDKRELEAEQSVNIPVITNRTFSVNEVKILLEKQKQACANEFIHAEMTMEQAKRRVLNAPTVSF